MVSSENIDSQSRETLFGTELRDDPRVHMIAKYADIANLSTEQVMAVINGTVDASTLTLPDGSPFAASDLGKNGQALFTSLARDGFELPEIINQLQETREAAAQNPDLYDQLLNKTDRNTGQTVNIEAEFLDDIRAHADAETDDEQARRRNMFNSEELQKLSQQFPEMAQIFTLLSGIMEMVDKLTRGESAEEEVEMAQSQETELDPVQQQQEQQQIAVEMMAAEEMQEQEQVQEEGVGIYAWMQRNVDQTLSSIPIAGALFENEQQPAQEATMDTGFGNISFDGISFDGDFSGSLGNLSTPQVTMSQEFLAQQRETANSIG